MQTSITVNGTALTDPGGGGQKAWSGTVTGELTTIFSSTNAASLYYIKVDGKLLVDSSVPGGGGATTVDKSITSAGQLTVASDSDLAKITGGVLYDRWYI